MRRSLGHFRHDYRWPARACQGIRHGPGEHLCTPCGDCRQRIREFATPSTQIMVLSKQGEVLKTYTMDSLLPDAFGPEQLPGR